MKALLSFLALAGVLALLAFGLGRREFTPVFRLVGRRAPDFQLELYDGDHTRLSDLRGRAVALNFWASWCTACRAEAPILEAAWEKYRGRGFALVGVAVRDDRRDALGFIHEFGKSYLLGPDPGAVAIDYGLFGVPETVLIGPDGIVRKKIVGPVQPAQFERDIVRLLAEAQDLPAPPVHQYPPP